MERRSTLTSRLKEAARVERRGGSAEKQEWDEGRRFGGRIVVERKEEALRAVKEWDRPDTVWTDGSRQEDGAVGAACVWRSPEGGERVRKAEARQGQDGTLAERQRRRRTVEVVLQTSCCVPI